MLSKPVSQYDDAELQGIVNLCMSALSARKAAREAASRRRQALKDVTDIELSGLHGRFTGEARVAVRAELADRNAKRKRAMELASQGGGAPGKEGGVGLYGDARLNRGKPHPTASQTMGPTYGS